MWSWDKKVVLFFIFFQKEEVVITSQHGLFYGDNSHNT